MLDDVRLAVPTGRHLGLVGRTGSGKTTVGRLVGRLWDTEQGAVLVGGIDVRDLRQGDLRRRIGIATQDVELFRATVRDNLTLFGAVDVSDGEIAAAIDQVGLGGWLDGLADGLDEHLDGDGGLSAGESQLLALARLLLADPSVVILDEGVEAASTPGPRPDSTGPPTCCSTAGRRSSYAHRLTTLDRVDDIAVLDHGRLARARRARRARRGPHERFHALPERRTFDRGGGATTTTTDPTTAPEAPTTASSARSPGG